MHFKQIEMNVIRGTLLVFIFFEMFKLAWFEFSK